MAARPKRKMARSARAKQFAPFAALKGFESALAEKERPKMERPVLTDEAKEELDKKLLAACSGSEVDILYYSQCVKLCFHARGKISRVDRMRRVLSVGDRQLALDDILDIREL